MPAEGFHIVPGGECITKTQNINCQNTYSLVFSGQSAEMIRYEMPAGTKGTFGALDYPGEVELYYIARGEVTFCIAGKEERRVKQGDTFCIEYGSPMVTFHVEQDITWMMFSNRNVYQIDEKITEKITSILVKLQEQDGDTYAHCERVRRLVIEIAQRMNFPNQRMRNLVYAAIFHDVGKYKIPLEILLKPGRLSQEEYEIMKNHSHYSADVIRPIFGDELADIVLAHHERLDGSGYPSGLTEAQIPIEAKMISVADSYDAMVTVRPYNKGKSKEEAIAELRRCVGTQFDPACVDALCAYLEQIECAE